MSGWMCLHGGSFTVHVFFVFFTLVHENTQNRHRTASSAFRRMVAVLHRFWWIENACLLLVLIRFWSTDTALDQTVNQGSRKSGTRLCVFLFKLVMFACRSCFNTFSPLKIETELTPCLLLKNIVPHCTFFSTLVTASDKCYSNCNIKIN